MGQSFLHDPEVPGVGEASRRQAKLCQELVASLIDKLQRVQDDNIVLVLQLARQDVGLHLQVGEVRLQSSSAVLEIAVTELTASPSCSPSHLGSASLALRLVLSSFMIFSQKKWWPPKC